MFLGILWETDDGKVSWLASLRGVRLYKPARLQRGGLSLVSATRVLVSAGTTGRMTGSQRHWLVPTASHCAVARHGPGVAPDAGGVSRVCLRRLHAWPRERVCASVGSLRQFRTVPRRRPRAQCAIPRITCLPGAGGHRHTFNQGATDRREGLNSSRRSRRQATTCFSRGVPFVNLTARSMHVGISS